MKIVCSCTRLNQNDSDLPHLLLQLTGISQQFSYCIVIPLFGVTAEYLDGGVDGVECGRAKVLVVFQSGERDECLAEVD